MQGVPATNHQPSISPRVTVQNPLSHQGVRPPLTLVLGPAGAGKTAWALQRFIACHEAGERPLLIVSSPQQAQTRAEQLAEHLDCQPATILPSLRTFRQLATDIAPQEPDTETDSETDGKSDSNENTRLIGRSFQRLALADIFRNTIRPDDFLGRMRHAPGFVPALSERLREWKLACLDPDTLEQSGPILAAPLADPTFARKTGDLARLYRAYESFLKQNRLRDDEDCLRDAVARARSGKGLQTLLKNTTCILVDGFYRFNPMQRLLLAALAEQQLKVVVTLPYEERRPLLFAAPARTLSLLQKEFTCHLLTLPDRTKREISPLGMLSGGVFLGIGGSREYWGYSRVFEGIEGIEGIGENQSMPSNAPNTQEHPIPTNTQKHLRIPNTSPPLLLFDAPNPYVEAEMVAREFRRLYDAGGYAWGDFGVILRAMGDYAPILAAVFERHGIPLGVDGPETLTENPMLKTLLHLLAVVRRNWQRDDVLAFLKSSYTAPDRLEADALRRRARRAGVREGREQWLSLMGEMREEGRGKREEEEEEKWKEIPGGEEGEGEEWHGEWEEVGNEEIIEEWG